LLQLVATENNKTLNAWKTLEDNGQQRGPEAPGTTGNQDS